MLVGAATAWPAFRSSEHFEVRYPTTWVRVGSDNGLGESTARLELRSSRGGAEGSVIRRGQAFLSVADATGEGAPDLAALVAARIRSHVVVRRDSIPGSAASGACPWFVEVDTRDPAAPPGTILGTVPDVNTAQFYCPIGTRRFVTFLSYYAGDPKQDVYRAVALRVARSLRTTR